MKGGYDMNQLKMPIKRHILIANKLLAVMSGLNRQTKRDDRYYYEKHALGLAENFIQIKWTSSLIKLVIAYVSKCNSQGIISLISEQELAQTIHCSVRTIQNNNKLLEASGILTWDRLWGEYIQVSLCDYLESFLDLHKKEQATQIVTTAEKEDSHKLQLVRDEFFETELEAYSSKSGYTSISDEVIYLLLAVDNINVLRLALRALFTYEKDVNVKKETEALLSYSEVKHVLPRYIGYKSAIKKMAAKLNAIFKVEVFEKEACIKTFIEEKATKQSVLEKVKDGFILSFHLVGSRDSKTQKILEKFQAEHLFTQFEKRFQSFGQYSMKKETIYSLAYEFGLSILEKTLTSIMHDLQTLMHSDVPAFHDLIRYLEENLATYIRKIANGYYQAKITA